MLKLVAKRRIFSFSVIRFSVSGLCNHSSSSNLFDKFCPASVDSSYVNEMPKIVPSVKDEVVKFSSDLVDNGIWPVPVSSVDKFDNGLARNSVSASVIEDYEGDCRNFDLIDDLRVLKKLFYKLDKDSREYEEYNIDFHHKKTMKRKRKKSKAAQNDSKQEIKKQHKLNRDNVERENKKLEKQETDRKKDEIVQKFERKKLELHDRKKMIRGTMVEKHKNDSLLLDNRFLQVEVNEDDTTASLIDNKKVRKPTFNQLTDPYHMPFCLDIFITKGSVRACIVHRVTSKVVSVAHSISKDMKFDLISKKDAKACASVGGVLAQRALEDDIYNVVYTPRKGDKIEGKLQVVLQSIIDNGVDVKVKLKQKRHVKGKQMNPKRPVLDMASGICD